MPRTRTSLTVGVFVLVGFAVATAAVVWLGLSMRFEEGSTYAAYFDESVQGLSTDSPVKYRGVSVGRVQSIEVAPDTTLIEVVLKIESGLAPEADMVAQLKSVGITGIMYVELDRRDPGAPDLSPRISFPSNYPVIATRPSEIARFFGEISALLERIGALDLKGISANLVATLEGLRQSLAGLDTAAISADMRQAFRQVTDVLDPQAFSRTLSRLEGAAAAFEDFSRSAGETVRRIDQAAERFEGFMARNDPELTATVSELRRSASAARELLNRGDALVGRMDVTVADLKRQLVVTLQQMESAGENLKLATEAVSDQPSRLFFGSPPPERLLPERSAP